MGGRLAEHPRGLDQPLDGQPGIEEAGDDSRARDVERPQRRDVGRWEREPRRAADGLEHREVEAGLLREGARRDLPVGAERALGGQQRQPAFGDGRAELLDPNAVLVQRLQQREPRRARVLVEAVEEPERREVRLGHAGTAAATGATATGMPLGPRCR